MANKGIHGRIEKLVLRNLYRTYYDIPGDLSVRKPEAAMKIVVESS